MEQDKCLVCCIVMVLHVMRANERSLVSHIPAQKYSHFETEIHFCLNVLQGRVHFFFSDGYVQGTEGRVVSQFNAIQWFFFDISGVAFCLQN